VDIDAANIEGRTALHVLAAQHGDPSVSQERRPQILEAARLLLAMGIDTKVVDRNGNMAVDLGPQDSLFAETVNSTR
jgi:hypothetical protein